MYKEIKFTQKEQIFYSKYVGNYETPKKLNRSDKRLDDVYVDAIESGNTTSEMITEIGQRFPIFVYKTCITIHGNLGTIGRNYIGGYKNIIQNKNGSLEIKYSAIDNEVKKDAACVLRQKGWNNSINSTSGIVLFKTKRTTDKSEAMSVLAEFNSELESIQSNTQNKLKVLVSGMNYFGMYYVTIQVYPLIIYGGSESLCNDLGIPPNEFQQISDELRLKKEVDAKQYEEREMKRNEVKNLIEDTKQKLEANLVGQKVQIQRSVGTIYISVVCNSKGIGYRFLRIDSLGSFGRVNASTYFSVDKKLDESLFKSLPKQERICDFKDMYLWSLQQG